MVTASYRCCVFIIELIDLSEGVYDTLTFSLKLGPTHFVLRTGLSSLTTNHSKENVLTQFFLDIAITLAIV